MALSFVICNICAPEEGRFNVWNQTFTDGDAEKAALFQSFFPHILEIAQPDFTRKEYAADGTKRTLSRIDRAFINLTMAEARVCHCSSHVFENLGERSIPSDHAAVRVVIQNPTARCNQVTRIQTLMSKHSITSTLTTHSLLWLTSRSFSRKQENRLIVQNTYERCRLKSMNLGDSLEVVSVESQCDTHPGCNS